MAEKAWSSACSGARARLERGTAAAVRGLSALGTRMLSGLFGAAGASGRQRKGGRVDTGPAVPLDEERGRAQALHDHARSVVAALLEAVRWGGRPDLEPAASAVRQLLASVSRNPNALLSLTRLKDPDRYTSMHSVNVCVFALAFGQQLGLGRRGLYELGLGALLHDLGKMRVPRDILDKAGPLTAAESRRMRMHPAHGRDLLAAHGDLPQAALAAVYLHHERHDGTGYPEGLSGREIPLFARVVALCDVYDALTSPRGYSAPVSELVALRTLCEGRGTAFHPRLVDTFIRCIGVYPVGSLVVLSSGEIALVTSVHPEDRSRPVVKPLFDSKQRPYRTPRSLDLHTGPRDAAGRPTTIRKVLDPAGPQRGSGMRNGGAPPPRPECALTQGGGATLRPFDESA